MPDGKRCNVCGEVKSSSDFYAHPKMTDGLLGKCKVCHRKHMMEKRAARIEYYRQYDRDRASLPHRVADNARILREYRSANPDRVAANNAVARALRDGRLKRQPCWVCGKRAVAHHPDYSSPLDVVWLCQVHHKAAHAAAAAA